LSSPFGVAGSISLYLLGCSEISVNAVRAHCFAVVVGDGISSMTFIVIRYPLNELPISLIIELLCIIVNDVVLKSSAVSILYLDKYFHVSG
jgi:hypothetical protein